MGSISLPFDPEIARLVKADTLEPHQQITAQNFKTATDFRQQVMIKHPFLSDFHCWAEHLHAGLLEGNPAVSSYVPQPFRVRIRRRLYTADCYVVTDNQPRCVVELKPRGEMPDDMRIPLVHFFAQYGMQFDVVSNEAVYERMIEAENWLEIVRILNQSKNLSTTDAEQIVMERLYKKGPCNLGDLIDPGDRDRTYYQEISLFRLLHRGQLTGELTDNHLDFDTGLSLCA